MAPATHLAACRGAFGLSTAVQNNAIACLGEKTVYIAGKFVVLCDNTPSASPRLRISTPAEDVQTVVSIAVSHDHTSLAAIERRWAGHDRISFWSAAMALQPPSFEVATGVSSSGKADTAAAAAAAAADAGSGASGAWDVAWAADGNYVATVTRTGVAEEVSCLCWFFTLIAHLIARPHSATHFLASS